MKYSLPGADTKESCVWKNHWRFAIQRCRFSATPLERDDWQGYRNAQLMWGIAYPTRSITGIRKCRFSEAEKSCGVLGAAICIRLAIRQSAMTPREVKMRFVSHRMYPAMRGRVMRVLKPSGVLAGNQHAVCEVASVTFPGGRVWTIRKHRGVSGVFVAGNPFWSVRHWYCGTLDASPQ